MELLGELVLLIPGSSDMICSRPTHLSIFFGDGVATLSATPLYVHWIRVCLCSRQYPESTLKRAARPAAAPSENFASAILRFRMSTQTDHSKSVDHGSHLMSCINVGLLSNVMPIWRDRGVDSNACTILIVVSSSTVSASHT